MMGQRSKAKVVNIDEASAIALQALTFLAADMTRLGRFLAMTGLGPGDLRAAASTSGLQAAVLEHLLGDESLLLVFAAESGLAPELIGKAHQVLTGPLA